MKHSLKIILLLIGMFFVTQLIGLAVLQAYSPVTKEIVISSNETINRTVYNLPYGMEPPENIAPKTSLISIIISLFIAVTLMLILMKIKAEFFLRAWFFFVVILAISITLNAFFIKISYSALLALIIAIPLAYIKVFKRHILVHNVTELAIYPGIAAIFVPLLNVITVVFLLILISIYDIYAVWHAGFMQKMAKYQIQKLKFFSGFLVPYIGKKERKLLLKNNKKGKKVKVQLAILGGGDVVFPIILAGVVLRSMGIIPALIISLGATLALATLFYISEKGKFYPAMPFITMGCFIALLLVYLF